MPEQLPCILLIDDNPDDNYLHKRVILKAGVADKVEVAYNGEEALRMLGLLGDDTGSSIVIPQLILLDLNMPGMDGWEFLKHYSRLAADQKSATSIVVVSSSENPEDLEMAKNNPLVKGVIHKPLDTEKLTELVTNYLEGKF